MKKPEPMPSIEVQVQALVDLQFHHRFVKAGTVFTIEAHEFRPRQMARVTEATPAIDPTSFRKPGLPFPDDARVRQVAERDLRRFTPAAPARTIVHGQPDPVTGDELLE